MIQFGLPLLEGVCTLLLTMLEAAKAHYSSIVVEYNAKIKETVEPEVKTKPIGFIHDIEEEEDDDSLL